MVKQCLRDNCKWVKQGASSLHCSHPQAIKYHEQKKPCTNCGRVDPLEKWLSKCAKDKFKTQACGNCIGRGKYIYHTIYEDCDCGGYEQKKEINNEK